MEENQEQGHGAGNQNAQPATQIEPQAQLPPLPQFPQLHYGPQGPTQTHHGHHGQVMMGIPPQFHYGPEGPGIPQFHHGLGGPQALVPPVHGPHAPVLHLGTGPLFGFGPQGPTQTPHGHHGPVLHMMGTPPQFHYGPEGPGRPRHQQVAYQNIMPVPDLDRSEEQRERRVTPTIDHHPHYNDIEEEEPEDDLHHSTWVRKMRKRIGGRDRRKIDASLQYSTVHSSIAPYTGEPLLLSMPPEIIDAILKRLTVYDLASLAGTCHALREHAIADVLWLPHIQAKIPSTKLMSPEPFTRYMNLFAHYDLVWCLPRYKIWVADKHPMGAVILVRYDPRRNMIEGFRMLVEREETPHQAWDLNPQVIIQGSNPHVVLHLEDPALRLRPNQPEAQMPSFDTDIPLDDAVQDRVHSSLVLTKPLPHIPAMIRGMPGYRDAIWPSVMIPANHHVRSKVFGADKTITDSELPHARVEVTDKIFRIRQWMGTRATDLTQVPLNVTNRHAIRPLAPGPRLARFNEMVFTYTTLLPKLYTPTLLKPWRGIWYGDYGQHGTEFLLINQPDDAPAEDVDLGLVRLDAETDEEWEKRRTEARINRGSLEAIKLTGDPNVPRGEVTFRVPDLGPLGFIDMSKSQVFEGVRVVKSEGHIASWGFVQDRYIPCELYLISHDRLAQHWLELGIITYFSRVDIDGLLSF